MLEEGEIVDGDDRGDVQSQRHRVVRAVPHVDAEQRGQAAGTRLLPHEARRASGGNLVVHPGFGCERGPARTVTLPTEEMGLHFGAPREVGGDVERVIAGADRSLGDRRHVEEQAHGVRL